MTNTLSIDPQYKLNIYITEISPLGYTINWPWDISEYSRQNGVVIQPGTLPSGSLQGYNEGKTAVHEVGHYLGLFHTFENECTSPGDMVDDTPYHKVNYDCPSENTDTCPQTGNDPIHNFMNYTSDPCMNQFTNGQIQRVRGILYLYKPRLGNQFAPAKIDYFYQQPDPLYNGGMGDVYAVLAPGIDNVTYSWYASYSPTDMTFHFTPQGNRCQVDYYIPYNTLPTINFTCVAINAYGTDVKSYQLHCALYGYGPASLAFAKNGTLIDENPILVSSVDSPGVEVTDYYLINKEITPENNTVSFSIHESDQAQGNTFLDQVELWEVKAGKNEFAAVTDEGEIISYKKLVTPNQIILNDTLDITKILADKDEIKITVKKGDKIKIKHSGDSEELYSVFYAQLYNAEDLSAVNNNSSELYYFRPQSSSVCKKLNVVPTGDIEIAFSKALVLDYFALVRNEKTAKAEKLNLLSAEHSKAGETASLFAAVDNQNGEILPGEEIKFKYATKRRLDNDNSAYILKTVGRYENTVLRKEGEFATNSTLPKDTELHDSYPNPFNPTTKISFSLAQKSRIILKVFDLLGREIKILADGIYEAGKYEFNFDGSTLPSGLYFYNLTHGANSITKKMLLIK